MSKTITLLEKASKDNYEYNVFEFNVDENNDEYPVSFNKKKIKADNTLIRVGEGVIGEVSEGGVKKPIMSSEVYGYFDMINKLRADKDFKGTFTLESVTRSGETSYRVIFNKV